VVLCTNRQDPATTVLEYRRLDGVAGTMKNAAATTRTDALVWLAHGARWLTSNDIAPYEHTSSCNTITIEYASSSVAFKSLAYMSAYASLPGSFLPPFFSFGASSTSSNSSNTNTLDKKDGTEQSKCTADTSSSVPPNTLDSLSAFDPNFDSKKCTTQSKDTDVPSESEVAAAAALPSASTSSSRPSDIIIAIRSARVDPVALIKSLTSTGSNIARRTASFIVRTPEVDNCSAAKLESSLASMDEVGGGGDGHADKEGGSSDRSSVISRPGLCYEDSDSDEEFSMYDYSDDFSSPNDDNKIDAGLHHEEEQLATSSDGNDPSAIEFELSITFQGRKYNATRGFPTFVKLREDLLHELKNNDRRSRRYMGGTKSPVDGMDVDSTKKKVDAFQNKDCHKSSLNESLSVPELPRVSPESLGHGGYALCGVARSGFALLQATAQHYCPEMERWMRHVIETFPCSQSLSSFLWEPLSSSNASWETIGEGKQSTSCNDMGHNVKLGSLDSASTSFAKPPLHTRSKPKPNNCFSKTRYKTMGSVGSLNSIEEDDGNDCDDDRR